MAPEEEELTRKEPHGAREILLDAAETLINERGFARTSIEDIALASAVSVDVVHAHFADKAAILRALAARFLERVMATIDSATRSGSWSSLRTRDLIEVAVRSLLGLVLDNAPLYRAILTEGEGELTTTFRTAGAHLTTRVVAVLAECKGGEVPPERDVGFALNMCAALAHDWIVVGEGWSGIRFTREEMAVEATRAVLGYLDNRPRT
jgi:AcrR family transcriptional regulator